ncbi:hypothetical protein QEN19_001983 [Hanseniaspora menglaensis]
MSDNNIEEQFNAFKKGLTNTLVENIPSLINIATDLRLTKSTEISSLILKNLQESKNDETIFFYFKLIDSILNLIKVPYNKKLSENLSTLFKKKYLMLNNSNRQKLIELFETWVERANEALTGNADADDMFEDGNKEFLPKETLKNIESFLVKASLLHEKRFLQKQATSSTNQSKAPLVEELVNITNKLIFFVDKSLDQNYSDTLYERLTFIKQVKNILQTSVLEQETLGQMEIQLKNLPEYQQSMNSNIFDSESNDARVNKFIEKSKSVKIEDLKELLGDLKSLDLINQKHEINEEKKSIQSIWTAEMFQQSLENFNKKSLNNIEKPVGQTEDDKLSFTKKLPDLTMLSNINKDLQSAKLLLTEFLQLNIQNNNFKQWSKYIQLLYRNLPEKCQICGKRFPLTKTNMPSSKQNKRSILMVDNPHSGSSINLMDESNKNIERHMDMHYEAISKSSIITKQGIRKVMVNRTWYSTANSDTSVALKGFDKDGENIENDLATKKRKLADNVSGEGVKSYVIVPNNLMSHLNEIECEICKDKINVSFVESVGEWCMLDCKEVESGYVHLSCHTS